MADFYFFTDPDKLKVQTEQQAFGPVDNLNYNLTNFHSSTVDAPVFACCNGRILIQFDKNFSNRLNILLKPSQCIKFGETRIKYFLYRGVKKDSLIDVSDTSKIAPKTTNDLTKRIWEYVESLNISSLEPSINSLGLHYSKSGVGDSLKLDSDILEEVFLIGNQSFVSPIVSAGDLIGEFNKDEFGFEVILDDFSYRPTFKNLRDSNTTYIVSDLSPINTSTLKVIDFSARQRVLNYMDSESFFSMCLPNQLNGYTDQNFNLIRKKYKFPGRLYIDVRNEFASYFNLYGNYTDKLQVDLGGNVQEKDYYSNSWPILIIDDLILVNGTDKQIMKLALPNGNNTKPLIYQATNVNLESFPEVIPKHNKRFVEYTVVGNYSIQISCLINCISTDNGIKNLSRYIKLFYLRQQDMNFNYSNMTSLYSKNSYLDSLFHLNLIHTVTNGTSKSILLSSELRFIDAIDETGFSGMVELCVCEENDRITFFTTPIDAFRDDHIQLEKLNSIVQNNPNVRFFDQISKDHHKIVTELTIGNQTKKLLSIIEKTENALTNTQFYEQYFCLSISKQEYLNLKATTVNLNQEIHPIYIAVNQITHLIDDSAKMPYSALKLSLKGTGNDGVLTELDASLNVYTNSATITSSFQSVTNEIGSADSSNVVQFLDNSSENGIHGEISSGINFRIGLNASNQRFKVVDKLGSPLTISATNSNVVQLPFGSRITLLKLDYLPIPRLNKRFYKVLFWSSIDSYKIDGHRMGYLPQIASRTFTPTRIGTDLIYDYPQDVLEVFAQDIERSMFISDFSFDACYNKYLTPDNSASAQKLFGRQRDFMNNLHQKIDVFRANLDQAILAKPTNPSLLEELYQTFESLFYKQTITYFDKKYVTNAPLNLLPESKLYFSDNPVEASEEYLRLVKGMQFYHKKILIFIKNEVVSDFKLKNKNTNVISNLISLPLPSSFGSIENVESNLNIALAEIFGLTSSELPILERAYMNKTSSKTSENLEYGYVISFTLRNDLDETVIEGVGDGVRIGRDTLMMPLTFNWYHRENNFVFDEINELDDGIVDNKLASGDISGNTGEPIPYAEVTPVIETLKKLYSTINDLSSDSAQEIKLTKEYVWIKNKIVDNADLRSLCPFGHRVWCQDARKIGGSERGRDEVFSQLISHYGSKVGIDQSLGVLNSNPLLSTIFHECKEDEMILIYPPELDSHYKENGSTTFNNLKDLENFPQLTQDLNSELRIVTQVNYQLPMLYIDYYLNIIN